MKKEHFNNLFMKTIIIIDDDIHIGNMLEEVLTDEGYSVVRAYSGTEALMLLENHKPDLILLDLMLPGLDGEKVLQRIKDIPVIVISAIADIDNKVKLLLSGAADYITKPFSIEELVARITVALRNRNIESVNELKFKEISLDISAHSASVSGQPVKLTKTEFAILKLLMQAPSQVIAKSVILDKISLDTPDCVESSLKVHISNLRRKLKNINGMDYIEAVWGIGFKMRES